MMDMTLLRIVTDDYDQHQRSRIRAGEQIRAIAQDRDQQEAGRYLSDLGYLPVMKGDKEVSSAADILLAAVLRGDTDNPHPYLAQAYRASSTAEKLAFSQMDGLLNAHPAWPWMSSIRGVGPTFGAKLLSRLDLSRANNASSFWSYCGLGTVPGQRWWCGSCGWVGIFDATYEVTGKHKGCKHLAIQVQGPEDGIRAAQPRAKKGEKRSYDAFAKKTMYLLAMSWLKSGDRSFYGSIYRDKVAFYEVERPGWEKGRRHYSALRAAEKLFLSHLYEAWCRAIGQEPVEAYAIKMLGHDGLITPQQVLDWEMAKAA